MLPNPKANEILVVTAIHKIIKGTLDLPTKFNVNINGNENPINKYAGNVMYVYWELNSYTCSAAISPDDLTKKPTIFLV